MYWLFGIRGYCSDLAVEESLVMIMQTFLGILLITMSTVSAFPCSIPSFPPSRFDITQYLLVGEVTGYVETKDLINRRQGGSEAAIYGKQADKTAGIIVRVKGALYTPREA